MTDINENKVENNEATPAATPAALPKPAVTVDPKFTAAAEFGRIDENGNVFVKDGSAERQIGNYPEGVPDQPLAIFIRRFLDLVASVDLFDARMSKMAPKDIEKTIANLIEQVKEPAAIGDLPALRERVEKLAESAKERIAQIAVEREAAKKQAIVDRTAVVEAAEKIAAQDPQKTQWKQSGTKLRELLDEWKKLQHHGPRIDRPTEDALWKRFSAARTAFEKARKHFFNELDHAQSAAKRAKEKLVAEAEKLSSSTDWGATAAAYRELMNQWKRAGRAGRKEDDALWERFHAAQQVFFDARKAQSQEQDAQMKENLTKKLELLEKAEAILPIKDLEAAKAALRPIQEAWDEIGFVPREDMSKVEGRMRAVENAIKAAEQEEWQRTDPEKQARAQGMLGQLQDSIETLKADIAAAEAKGDKKAVKDLEESLQAREAWLKQLEAF